MGGSSTDSVDQPIFYYDLGSPECYLAAETIMSSLPVAPEWEPLLGSELAVPALRPDRDRIAREARELGLQPVRWPSPWPPDTERAMLAATYAKRIGRAVAFSLAAFRQAFAGGRDLGDENTILISGAACEMHPTALRKGIELSSTRAALADAGRHARDGGVTELPAIQVGDRVFSGPGAIRDAAAALEPAPQ
jgi:2-hydroxychromene-2-carboxylate isomerase